MNPAVDVLDVVRRADDDLQRSMHYAISGELRHALSLLTELIEADRDYDAAISALFDLNRRIAESGWIEVEHDALRKAGAAVVRAQDRRRTSLARVGGAA